MSFRAIDFLKNVFSGNLKKVHFASFAPENQGQMQISRISTALKSQSA